MQIDISEYKNLRLSYKMGAVRLARNAQKYVQNPRGAPRLSGEFNDAKNRQDSGNSNQYDGLGCPGVRQKSVSKMKGYEHFGTIHLLRTQNLPKT